MRSIAAHAKARLFSIIEAMDDHSGEYTLNPKKDFTRKRKLTFSTVIKMIFRMEGGTLGKEMRDYFQFSKTMPTVSAFVQRRSRILSNSFVHIFHAFNDAIPCKQLYKGYRLIAGDGSDVLIARKPEDKENYYKSSPDHKGYNMLHLNAFYDLCSKRYVDVLIQPGQNKNEHQALCEMVDRYDSPSNAIFILDRGYESYNNFAHIEQKGLRYLVRVKDVGSNGILSGLPCPTAASFDIDVELSLTKCKSKKNQPEHVRCLKYSANFDFIDSQSNKYYDIKLRIVRFKISQDVYESIITNLDRQTFPANEIKKLYHMRWDIETSFRNLKHTLGLLHFHSKKVELITQEIYAKLILYNFCSIIVTHTQIPQTATQHEYKLNFSAASHTCKKFLADFPDLSPPNVEAILCRFTLPIRLDRHNPREVKTCSAVGFAYRLA